MTDREAFEAWFLSQQGNPYDGAYLFAGAAWNAAIAHMRENYTICEREPVDWIYGTMSPLYREAK